MGNCCSAPQSPAGPVRRPAPVSVGITNKVAYPFHNAGEVEVGVCSARWAANMQDQTPSVVKVTPHHAFVALFDGLGERGDAIAAFCRNAIYPLFLECCKQYEGDLSAALRATFTKLDERMLSSTSIPAKDKANSGASGVVTVINFATRQCVVANVGHAQCLLGRTVGSFNAKLPEGFFLTADHTLKSVEERVRVNKRMLAGELWEAGSSKGGVEMVQGVTQITRAFGFASCKRNADGKAGAISATPEVTEHKLTDTDQHLIVGSSGFWHMVGPQDAALRAHFYEKYAKIEDAKAQALKAAAGDGEVPTSPVSRQANAAEHLVLYGISKVADKLSRHIGQAKPMSVADMMRVPFERPPRTESLQQQPSGQPKEQQAVPFIRSELHGDMAAVVVTLRWQNKLSMDSQLREVMRAAQQATQESYLTRLVRARWGQVRMLVEFHRTYRRTLLRRWWDASDSLYRSGKVLIRARHLKERLINEQGLASGRSSPAGSAKGTPRMFGQGSTPRQQFGQQRTPAHSIQGTPRSVYASGGGGAQSGGSTPRQMGAGAGAMPRLSGLGNLAPASRGVGGTPSQITPRQQYQTTPRQGTGLTPRQGTGLTPRQGTGLTPKRGAGLTPRQVGAGSGQSTPRQQYQSAAPAARCSTTRLTPMQRV